MKMHMQLARMVSAYEEGDDDWSHCGGVPSEYLEGSLVRVDVFPAAEVPAHALRAVIEGLGGEQVHLIESCFCTALVPVRSLLALARAPAVAGVQLAFRSTVCN
jgi:hypothetical protein